MRSELLLEKYVIEPRTNASILGIDHKVKLKQYQDLRVITSHLIFDMSMETARHYYQKLQSPLARSDYIAGGTNRCDTS